jgi:putative membrane protein insertion efficiency factor
MKYLALWAIRGYKIAISPLLPSSCRFYPTCSEYAYQAIDRYGLLVGGAKAGWRILRCNPWTDGGYDPVDPEDRERHERAVAAIEAQTTDAPTPPSR